MYKKKIKAGKKQTFTESRVKLIQLIKLNEMKLYWIEKWLIEIYGPRGLVFVTMNTYKYKYPLYSVSFPDTLQHRPTLIELVHVFNVTCIANFLKYQHTTTCTFLEPIKITLYVEKSSILKAVFCSLHHRNSHERVLIFSYRNVLLNLKRV